MKSPLTQILATPRSAWSKQLLSDGFQDALDRWNGVLSQDAGLILAQGAIDKENRMVSGVASVEEISRTGWFISIDGMDISQFKKNPVVLASHCPYSYASMMPGAIGTVERVSKKENTLVFKNMTFDDEPLADAWFQKIAKRIVRMVSIGFIPVQWEFAEAQPKKKGDPTIFYLNIIKSELTEISPVSVGANRGAFIDIGQNFSPTREEGVDTATAGRLESRIAELEQSISQLRTNLNKQTSHTNHASQINDLDSSVNQSNQNQPSSDSEATRLSRRIDSVLQN
jgi:Caudovirus prohead serine protease